MISGGRDGGGGTSNGGKVDTYLVGKEGKSGDADGTRSATTLTVFESALADLSSGGTVLLGSDTGASGKLGLVSGFLWREHW